MVASNLGTQQAAYMILVRKQGFSLRHELFERRTLDVTGGKGVVRNHRGSLGVALLRATAKKCLRCRWTIGSGAMRSGSGPRASPSAAPIRTIRSRQRISH